jgi:hypothetical protein
MLLAGALMVRVDAFPHSVSVRDLDLMHAIGPPDEAQTPLLVDAQAVLALAVARSAKVLIMASHTVCR